MHNNSLHFSWIDYTLFIATLSASVLIGIYYGCFGTKQRTEEEYLHGGRKMRSFPIGMSLTASHISGITVLGIPAEIYLFGTQYAICVLSVLLLLLSILYVYLPVYHKLQVSSSFEYLKMRFSPEIRTLASLIYTIGTILHVPIVIYVPSLALNQVTGINIYIISPLICFICVFYTTLGGLKAVVLSDTVQLIVTVLTMLMVVGIGTYKAGGVSVLWNNALEGDRIEFFNMSLDPTLRQTFWGVVIGTCVTFIGNLGINPSTIQRFLSLPTFKSAKIAAGVFMIGTLLAKVVTCWIGLILFTTYMNCDPFLTNTVTRTDQLLPYYLLDSLGSWKGLPGLFVAGVCGTALSTMSTCINTLSLTIFEDFIKPRLPSGTSIRTKNIIIKAIVVLSGLLCLIFIFLIEKLGGVLQISLSFHALSHGPLVGITTLGMLFPMANKHGALWGGISSLIITGILVFGAQVYMVIGRIKYAHKPQSIAHCDFNVTSTIAPKPEPEKPPLIFQISFYYFTLIGALVAITVGLIVSWFTKRKDEPAVHRDLLCPLIYRFLPKESATPDTVVYDTVENALIKLKSAIEEENFNKVEVNSKNN